MDIRTWKEQKGTISSYGQYLSPAETVERVYNLKRTLVACNIKAMDGDYDARDVLEAAAYHLETALNALAASAQVQKELRAERDDLKAELFRHDWIPTCERLPTIDDCVGGNGVQACVGFNPFYYRHCICVYERERNVWVDLLNNDEYTPGMVTAWKPFDDLPPDLKRVIRIL